MLFEEPGAVGALAAAAYFIFSQFLAFFCFASSRSLSYLSPTTSLVSTPLPLLKWCWSLAAFTEVSFDSDRRFMTASSPYPLPASAPHTDPPSRLITASNLRELTVWLSTRCSILHDSLLISLGSQGVAVGGYGFHFWMSDISWNPRCIKGINSHKFEGFLNFLGVYAKAQERIALPSLC